MARRRKNSPRENLIVAAILHAVIFGLLAFFAAREGYLGTQLKDIAVVLVPKEKPPEPPKPPPEPKIEPPKVEEPQKIEQPPPKLAEAPKPVEAPPKAAAPPQGDMAPVAAPAAVIPADFSFGDGAKEVASGTNSPVDYYRNFVEYTLRSNWTRPEGIPDDTFVDIVEVRIDAYGDVKDYKLKTKSGNPRWDDSVRQALATTKSIGRLPPRGFPARFEVRFDVLPATETVAQ